MQLSQDGSKGTKILNWIDAHKPEFYSPIFAGSLAMGLEFAGDDPIKGPMIAGALYGIVKFGQCLHYLDSKRNPVYRAAKYLEDKSGEKKVTEYFTLYDGKPV